jgi:tungstate transport system substrate-binding protein
VKLPSLLLLACSLFAFAACGGDGDRTTGELMLGSTTTTQDTGLLDMLVEEFQDRTGYRVTLVVGGSGQVIEQAARGDLDALLVHSPAAERQMVDDGDAIERTLVMHNDFVLIGPADDPAGAGSASSVSEAFASIASSGSPFVSRGDDSGTHVKELAIWSAAGVDPSAQDWYEETGQGQGATMQVANQRDGYALTDRGTFLAQQDDLGLTVLFEGDGVLLNVYHALLVNPATHNGINEAAGRAFIEFITSADIQALIGQFGVEEYGEPLFTPDAGKPEPAE